MLLLAVLVFGPVPAWAPAMTMIMALGLYALYAGPNRYLPVADRGPWRGLSAACVLFAASGVIASLETGKNAALSTLPLASYAFIVVGYLGIGWSFISMLRHRRAGEDDPARWDAILVGLATAFLTWTFVIAPAVNDASLSTVELTGSFFPVIDVVLIVLVVQLMLTGGARQPALWMIVLGAVALLVSNLFFALQKAHLVDISQHTIESFTMLMFVLLPTAALHPSMRTLTEPQVVRVEPLGPMRMGMISLVVIVPIVVTSLVPPVTRVDGLVRAGICVLLVLAVLGRVFRSNNSQARAEQLNRRRATHDTLTDLPNRELLAETVSRWGDRAVAENLEISLLFLDLDRFKMVNDQWGHQVGDELLCAVAARLGELVRGEDLVCRIGGDEFVIALASPSHLRLADSLADRVLTALGQPFRLSVGEVSMSASIGVAKSPGGAHAVELIRDADTAMYKAKGSGRNAYAFFDDSLREQVRDQFKLEQALHGALERGELAVHFQPIIDLESDELDGFEALMRWQSPELGIVSPMEFIPVAEETGMIVEMGSWLLRESARQLVEWIAERGPDARPLHVSVNVAVRQLRDGSLVRIVEDVLAETGLPTSALWLEITESGVMEDIETALRTLNALHALGVTLCIDDFGTGYSSLSYLHRLPVGIVKIDRSFVSDVGAQGPNEPIVRAVLAMTRAMGHRVVAEGVETELQRDWLRDQGCELAQGWFYGKADRPANLDHWIRRQVTA